MFLYDVFMCTDNADYSEKYSVFCNYCVIVAPSHGDTHLTAGEMERSVFCCILQSEICFCAAHQQF